MCASAAESRRSIWFTGEEHINTLILRKGQDQEREPALFSDAVDASQGKGGKSGGMEEDFEKDFDRYLEYLRQSVEILCTEYGEVGGFWFDGNWSRPDADWKLDELYGMIRRLQPNALIINNTGLSARGPISFSISGRTGVGLFLRSCRRACGLSGGGCGSMVLPSMKDARIISAVRLMISA